MLRKLWRTWQAFGQAVGEFISRVALFLFYFTVFVPFALAVRFFMDPLGMKYGSESSFWIKRALDKPDIDGARKGF